MLFVRSRGSLFEEPDHVPSGVLEHREVVAAGSRGLDPDRPAGGEDVAKGLLDIGGGEVEVAPGPPARLGTGRTDPTEGRNGRWGELDVCEPVLNCVGPPENSR